MAIEFPHFEFFIYPQFIHNKALPFFSSGTSFGARNALIMPSVKVLHLRDFGGSCMSCRDTIHLICMYLEGKLSSGVQSEIERHLDSCSDCRLVLEAATTTLDRYFGPVKIPAGTQAA
jgi:Putative zinc-finger